MAFSVEIVRPDDLLHLTVAGENLRIDTSVPGAPMVTLDDATQPGFLIVRLAPQTVVEEAMYQSSATHVLSSEKDVDEFKFNREETPKDVVPPHTRARIGRPSRLVFRVPAQLALAMPFSIEGLLDWANLDLNVSPLAALPLDPTLEERLAAPAIAQPGALDTAIEIPYRLVLSPNAEVTWLHDRDAVARAGYVPLWHTRLAMRDARQAVTELSRDHPAPVRAIWSEDYDPSAKPPFGGRDADWQPDPPLTAMTPSDRFEIVALTSGFNAYVADEGHYLWYEPRPVEVSRLMLSALGGWLVSRGGWSPPATYSPPPWWIDLQVQTWKDHLSELGHAAPKAFPVTRFGAVHGEAEKEKDSAPSLAPAPSSVFDHLPQVLDPRNWADSRGTIGNLLNVEEWAHIATLGRDHYVRIVYQGFLLPLGHHASLVKVTERMMVDDDPLRGRLAHLVQRQYIIVREPLRNYRDPAVLAELEDQGRGLPFRSVRLTTVITPDIADPSDPLKPNIRLGATTGFWVRLGTGQSASDDFMFHGVGEDVGGNLIDLTLAMVFVPNEDVTETGYIDEIRSRYDAAGGERRCTVPGEQMSFVEGGPPNATLTTSALFFTTQPAPKNKSFGGFLPKLLMAQVQLPAVDLLTGKASPVTIALHDAYTKPEQNPGNVNGLFAWVVNEIAPGKVGDASLSTKFQAKDAGGLATPNLAIKTLTSELGPLAGTAQRALSNGFDAADFFGDLSDAKLFGTFPLTRLIVSATASEGAPKMRLTETGPPPAPLVGMLDWKPKMHDVDIPPDSGKDALVRFLAKNQKDAALDINVRVVKTLDGSAPTTTIHGELTDFAVELAHVILVRFERFTFALDPGSKPVVNVGLDSKQPIEFLGDLTFVERLKEALPPDLFGDGPSLDIDASGVKAGFSIGFPPVALGVFALRDMSLGAYLQLPFVSGKPLLDFAFCRREKPFNLTVSFLGGGGYFHLQTDTDGVKMLEAALEFGASASVNLGVASGGVHIMAGIYFSLQRKDPSKENLFATLGGYLRMGGELSVLKLISVSLEFYLAFTYDGDAAHGIATLTVKVEVLCFSKSVEITVEKSFGGSANDPYFVETFKSPAVWLGYADAFA